MRTASIYLRPFSRSSVCLFDDGLSLARTADNATVDRLLRVYTEQKGDLWLYEEQLSRWRKQSPTAAQGAEIARLEQCLSRLRVLIDDLLARGQQLRPHTIDAILVKSDAELGLDVLMGKLPLPTVPRPRPRKPSGGDEA